MDLIPKQLSTMLLVSGTSVSLVRDINWYIKLFLESLISYINPGKPLNL